MEERISIGQVAPDGMSAVLGVEKYLRRSLDHRLTSLVKLRASMVNGCAYCIDQHSRELLHAGENVQRLFAVAAWAESPFFTKQERAAFALADSVTKISEQGVPDDVWNDAKAVFSDKELADLILAIATINVWNRVALSTRMQPPPYDS